MKTTREFISAIILLVLAPFGPFGCDPGNARWQRVEFSRLRMGARTTLTIYTRDEPAAAKAAEAAFRRIEGLEAAISDWRLDSEVVALRTLPAGVPQPISLELAAALEASTSLAAKSKGCFDVTCGSLTQLWREARERDVWPQADAIEQALALCGWTRVHLRGTSDHPLIVLDQAGVWLDFGGIGKGLAADAALSELNRHGFQRVMVELGGDLAVGDPPPDRFGWRIRTAATGAVLQLSRCGVATSGATEQFIDRDGVRYSHLIDPMTGLPVVDRGVITVVAPKAGLADGWASAASIVGVEEARTLAASQDIRFISDDATAKP